jgi:methyl-accepting chemotaxis protein
MTTPRGTKDDRRLRNLLIQPTQQFRITFFSLFIGLAALLGFCAFQIWIFSSLVRALVPTTGEQALQVGEMVRSAISWSWIGLGVGTILFTIIVISLTLMVTHRIYGPMVAIRRHLKALLEGDYAQRTHLRKNDEFKDIAADLNALSEKLGGGSTPTPS